MLRRPKRSSTLSALSLATTVAVMAAGCTSDIDTESSASPTEAPYQLQVGVQLFMWPWESIAAECTEVLGPAGIDWVLTSPPQEHIKGAAWWTVYQPVSYRVESRLGSREEFADMVASCAEAGVDVIADAVINHMSASASGVGYAGTEYTKYEYPGLYTRSDFHNCNLTENDQIANYKDLAQVQTCELLALSDLDTASEKVQQTIAGYLLDLLDLGVAGFRIDAAKHIWVKDLEEIVALLPAETRIISEVIRGGGEPVQPEHYIGFSDTWEFAYSENMRSYFARRVISTAGNPSRFSGYVPSDSAVSFVSNHDTERNGKALTYKQANLFELATAMMLAEEYGQPMLYSGYAFSSYDAGPYQNQFGVAPVECVAGVGPLFEYEPDDWICQHRWPSTLAMVEFRDVVGTAATVNIVKGAGIYGFEREGKGFFLANASREPYSFEVPTGLPAGTYCDVISGGVSAEGGECNGNSFTVGDTGILVGSLDAPAALAIHLESRLD
ncbi:MAG: hypothetical protein RL198_107 [Actinomycetota bacterium]